VYGQYDLLLRLLLSGSGINACTPYQIQRVIDTVEEESQIPYDPFPHPTLHRGRRGRLLLQISLNTGFGFGNGELTGDNGLDHFQTCLLSR
jgi:hypothetical protein